MNPMRYFIYCRKSSEAEDRQVMSLESQLSTLQNTFVDRTEIEIAGIYEEAYSAKSPGRVHFSDMLSRIERGEAAGIIAWAPDRLARNSIDGGRIIYLLDCGVIRDLKFSTYTFENNSQGKFMLQIMFGQSKYYSDALSENVKRGNRTKIEKGWRPSQAPLGYVNDTVNKTIVKDPLRFPIVRKMFDMMLSGAFSPKQIAVIARDDWGLRTPTKKRIGGRPLAVSSVYKLLTNPFYTGAIVWGGQTYPGKHPPLVSQQELETVHRLLRRPGRPRPQRYKFAFTGMIRCGACGQGVTAEHKLNRQGHRYIYYHCSDSRLERCKEPSIEVKALEQQMVAFLQALYIAPTIEDWLREQARLEEQQIDVMNTARMKSIEQAISDTDSQLAELTGLRLRNLVTDVEFLQQRRELQRERLRLVEIATSAKPQKGIEPLENIISFNARATEWFLAGNSHEKRLIVETVGSNLTLTGKILNIEAAKPFSSTTHFCTFLRRRAIDDDVRTFPPNQHHVRQWMKETYGALDTTQGRDRLNNIRELRERFEPETLMKKASPSRWAEAA